MSNVAVIIVIGLLGGMAIGLQAPLSSLIGQRLGVFPSVFVVHVVGALAVGVVLVFAGGARFGEWQSVPPVAWLAGVMGVIGVSAIVFMVPRIGVAAAVTLIIAGQLMMAAAIDHFGMLGVDAKPINVQRVLGLGLVFIGAWWAMRR